jgi:S-adenosylmethionine hydrolase
MERLEALNAIVEWIDHGTIDRVVDGTQKVPERETGTIKGSDGITNIVTAVNPYFGNAFLGFHPDELKNLGITQGSSFILEVDRQQRNVYYGNSYGDVPLGEWVAFPSADDQILIARNHESAIATANLEVGVSVKILPGQP